MADTTLADYLQEARLVVDEHMAEPQIVASEGGLLGVFSARNPLKERANEDAAAIIPAGEHAVVLAVADGLGGAAAGERASRLALESLRSAVEHVVEPADFPGVMIVAEASGENLPAVDAAPSLRTAILNGLEQANREILALGTGAATTLSVVEITGNAVRSYHVGDSLILLVGGGGKIKWQTIPHSPVGYGVEAGLLDGIEAMHHEDRHLVSNVVGCADMRIDIGPARQLAPRDTLLLASDGLADNLHVDEIVERIRKGPLKTALQSLADEAAARMREPVAGRPSKADDLTFLLYRPVRTPRRETA